MVPAKMTEAGRPEEYYRIFPLNKFLEIVGKRSIIQKYIFYLKSEPKVYNIFMNAHKTKRMKQSSFYEVV